MNMQLSPHDPGVRAHLSDDAATERSESARKNRARTLLILAIGLAALAAFVWFLVQRANAPGVAAPPAGPPAVSVMVPGLVEVADRVSATGSISARRDMPVGVAGEGGQVVAIRAEAGQFVSRGQVLAVLDSGVQQAQLEQLIAGVAQANADARLAQSELDRALALVDRGFISKADIDRRTATRDAARARVKVAEAQVAEARQRLERLAIRAPEAGMVLMRMVEPGQVVSSGSGGLFRIAAGGQMELRAAIAEQDMPQLKVGQTATVTPVGSSSRYVGQVWLLEPVIDPQSRLGMARIALPASPDIRSGGFANVTIDGIRAQRPLVPQSAVLNDAGGSYVLIVDQDGKVARRVVTVGTISSAGLAITSGLSGREQVVVSAGAFLTPGETVKPVRKAAAAPAAVAG
jgi:RND family efflux transporter MFP subunit